MEEEQRLPKPDWDQFNPRTEQVQPRPPRRPPQKRPTVFSNYYTKREAAEQGQSPRAERPSLPQQRHTFSPRTFGYRGRGENYGHRFVNPGPRIPPPAPFQYTLRQGYPTPDLVAEARSPIIGFEERVTPKTHSDQNQHPQSNQTQNPDSSRPWPNHRRGGFGGGRSMSRPPFRRNTSTSGRGGPRPPNRKPGRPYACTKSMESHDTEGCCECEESYASYKCPQCLQKYCSVPCYKTHKGGINCTMQEHDERESRCKISKVQQGSLNKRERGGRVEYMYPTGDTIKPQGLQKLTQEPLKSKLVHLLSSQRLRNKIASLDSSSDPRGMMNSFADDKEFSQFRTFIIENLSNDLFH